MKKVLAKRIIALVMLMMWSSITTINYTQDFSQHIYGIISIYGDQMSGKTLASGQKYSPQALTVSHRSLPFGTRVEIENLSNGKKVEALVNDRGPIELNRIMDVSQQISDILGFSNDKTTFVKVTILEIGTSLPEQEPEPEFKPTPSAPAVAPPTPAPTPEPPAPVAEEVVDDYVYDEAIDELSLAEPQARAQEINEPQGFEEVQDFIVDDPLSNIIIGPEDEFVAAPEPPMIYENTTVTPNDARLLRQADEDPFADLFHDTSDPYSFQEVIDDTIFPAPTTELVENIEVRDLTHIQTNIVTLTNVVTTTNVMSSASTMSPTPAPTADPSYNENAGYHDAPTPINPNSLQIPNQDHYIVQLGAFSKQKNAISLYDKLRSAGFNAYVMDVKVKGQNLIRVRVGYFATLEAAVNQSDRLKAEFNLDSRVIKVEYE